MKAPTEARFCGLRKRYQLAEVPGVVSVTYNLAPKPPCTMEAV